MVFKEGLKMQLSLLSKLPELFSSGGKTSSMGTPKNLASFVFSLPKFIFYLKEGGQ
jgi:hypothetical protein